MIAMVAVLTAQALSPGGDGKTELPPQKKICRRFVLTGSIIASRPLCKTRADWDRFDEGNHAKGGTINDPVKGGWLGTNG